ncbi:uncharacterized protein [Periplaneta americana]|uniref:uncharacterized protein n=1 Tax=Periplaneta americana TaxID=6978 RepID=UPI0037E7962C
MYKSLQVETYSAFTMKSLFVVAVVSLGVLGFSEHSSSLDVDMAGLKVFLLSNVGLQPFTAAHLSRTRRNDEDFEEMSCCGDFNRDMVKKRAKLRRECYNSMRNKKFQCDKSKETLQAAYCAEECMCERQSMCDGNGNLKPRVFEKKCRQYFIQQELNDIAKSFCDEASDGAQFHAKGVAEDLGLKSCNLAAGLVHNFIHSAVLARQSTALELKTCGYAALTGSLPQLRSSSSRTQISKAGFLARPLLLDKTDSLF